MEFQGQSPQPSHNFKSCPGILETALVKWDQTPTNIYQRPVAKMRASFGLNGHGLTMTMQQLWNPESEVQQSVGDSLHHQVIMLECNRQINNETHTEPRPTGVLLGPDMEVDGVQAWQPGPLDATDTWTGLQAWNEQRGET